MVSLHNAAVFISVRFGECCEPLLRLTNAKLALETTNRMGSGEYVSGWIFDYCLRNLFIL